MANTGLQLLLVVTCALAFISCRPSYPTYIALPYDGHHGGYIQVAQPHPVLIGAPGLISTSVINPANPVGKNENATEPPEDEPATENVEEENGSESSDDGSYKPDDSDDGQYKPEAPEEASDSSDDGQYKPDASEDASEGASEGSSEDQQASTTPEPNTDESVPAVNPLEEPQIDTNLVNASPWLLHDAPVIATVPTSVSSQANTVIHSTAYAPIYASGYPYYQPYVAYPYPHYPAHVW